MSFEISIKKFRAAVDGIKNERDSLLIKTAYLLAARNCEILTKTNPVEILNNSSKPYGHFMKWKLADYEVSPSTPEKEAVVEKVLLVTMSVAKRGKRLKQKKEGEEETTLELKKEQVIEALLKFNQTKLLDRWQAGKVQIDPLLIKVLLGKGAAKVIALPASVKY